MQGQIFADSHRHCAMGEDDEDGHFCCKKGIGRTLLPYYCTLVAWAHNGHAIRYSTVKTRIIGHGAGGLK